MRLKELEIITLAGKPTATPQPLISAPQPPTPTPQADTLPVISITSAIPAETERETLAIEGTATDEHGIADVKVNVQSPGKKGLIIAAPTKREHEQFRADVQLEIGENTIIIEATDTIGQVGRQTLTVVRKVAPTPESPTPDATVKLSPGLPQRQGEVYAVIIAIADYYDARLNLQYTVKDAQGFYDVLTDPEYGGIPQDHIQLLLNEKATTRNIKSTLGTWLSRQAKPEDTVIIYYSGHGAPEGDKTYWVTYDADVNDLFASALSNDDIHTMLAMVTSERLITFLDACYSAATVVRSDQTRAIPTEIPWEKFAGKGRLVISASDGKQQSVELDELQHGVFTYYLIDGLKGKADTNQDGVVEVDEIWNYVKSQVTDAARKVGHPQTPVFQGTVTAGIPLTFNVPRLQEKRRQESLESRKDAITKLRREQKISVELFNKALDILEKGETDPILEDFLTGKISLERFKATF